MNVCQFCNASWDHHPQDIVEHENVCRFNPKNRKPAAAPPAATDRPSSTVEAFRRFGARLEKKAHDTKELDKSFFGDSVTLVATAIMCVANEAKAFADELEKEGWGK